jgi:hypothetical protein
MTLPFDCPWCEEPASLSALDGAHDELVCEACDTRVLLASDPPLSGTVAHEAA